MRFILFAFLFFSSLYASAQSVFSFDSSKSISKNNEIFPAGLSPGINSAQIQTIDLTNDGKDEWVVWDINSRILSVFEKNGEDFIHKPELTYLFPTDISGFLVLADFDQDGKKDLFTSTPLGIKVYKNSSTGNQVSWTLAQNFLRLDGAGNIPANNLDTPLIQDLDNDGDLDLVIFNFAQGDYLEFYKNTSIERKGSPDVDGFAFPESFWGNISFCSCEGINFGTRCDGNPINFRENPETNRIQHAGGHSVLYQDFSGDGIFDLVLGRDECSVLFYLPNQGSNTQPVFSTFSNTVPEYGPLPVFPIFHVGKQIDDQLIISLNTNETSAPFQIDFSNSILALSKNSSTQNPILQNQLLDLGENSRPFFKGNVFAGELWISANKKTGNKVRGELSRLSYSGNQFQVLNSDYLNLSSLDLLDLQVIEYGSVKNQSYLLVSGQRTNNGIPSQVLLQNQGSNYPDFSLSGLSLRIGDQLTFFPYQGKDHLLIASQNGSLTLYEVDLEGKTAILKSNNFLGFQDNPANRNLSVAVRIQENPDLYSVDQTGRIFLVKDMMNSEVREEVLVKIGDQNIPFRLGRNTWISIVNPGFDENTDLILGSRAGGISYLIAVNSSSGEEESFLAKVYPNPSSGPFKVISNKPGTARLVNAMGQILVDEIAIPANREVGIQAQALQPGVYFLQLETLDREVLVKKILIR